MGALNDIEKLCRDASYGEYEWDSLLRDISDYLHGNSSMLLHHAGNNSYNETLSHNHDPSITDLYNQQYARFDPRSKQSLELKPGQICTGQQIVSNSEYQDTAYYSDITLAANVKDSLHGVIADDDEFGRRAISIQCGFSSDFFGEADLAKLRLIMPHLQSALRDSLRLTRILASSQVPNSLFYGLIDPGFNLHFFDSQNAKNLADFKEDLTLSRAGVSGGSRAKAVSSAIQRAAEGRRCTIQLNRYQLSLDKIPAALGWTGLNKMALFIVSERQASKDVSVFSTAFGLTRRESEILNLLAHTEDKSVVCEQAEISYETLRWHLKNILAKTGYNRTSKLLSAISQNDLINSL